VIIILDEGPKRFLNSLEMEIGIGKGAKVSRNAQERTGFL
jgi:hypothetical protein